MGFNVGRRSKQQASRSLNYCTHVVVSYDHAVVSVMHIAEAQNALACWSHASNGRIGLSS